MKMFPFCPRYPSNLPHVSSSYPLNKNLSSADHPRILQPPNNRQAQEDYVTGEQCIHILANMITHCLRNNYLKLFIHYILKTLLGRFPCGCNLYCNLKLFFMPRLLVPLFCLRIIPRTLYMMGVDSFIRILFHCPC